MENYSFKQHFIDPIVCIIKEIESKYEGLLLRFKKYITGVDMEIFDLKNKQFNILIKLHNRFPK